MDMDVPYHTPPARLLSRVQLRLTDTSAKRVRGASTVPVLSQALLIREAMISAEPLQLRIPRRGKHMPYLDAI